MKTNEGTSPWEIMHKPIWELVKKEKGACQIHGVRSRLLINILSNQHMAWHNMFWTHRPSKTMIKPRGTTADSQFPVEPEGNATLDEMSRADQGRERGEDSLCSLDVQWWDSPAERTWCHSHRNIKRVPRVGDVYEWPGRRKSQARARTGRRWQVCRGHNRLKGKRMSMEECLRRRWNLDAESRHEMYCFSC